jgi:hypothetical protein
MPWLHIKLRQNGVTKRLSSDASAIGDKENSAVGHGFMI